MDYVVEMKLWENGAQCLEGKIYRLAFLHCEDHVIWENNQIETQIPFGEGSKFQSFTNFHNCYLFHNSTKNNLPILFGIQRDTLDCSILFLSLDDIYCSKITLRIGLSFGDWTLSKNINARKLELEFSYFDFEGEVLVATC